MNMHQDRSISTLEAKVAVLEERISQVEDRCDKKDVKIDALMAFQHKVIGYAMGASAIIAAATHYLGIGG